MKKEDYLKSIVEKIIGFPCGFSHPRLKEEEIYNENLNYEIRKVYQKLGGSMNNYPINYKWDIKYPNFIIELDEELHFNRYRFETLQSSIYNDYNNFKISNYIRYCQVYENKCLKAGSYGGTWKNASADKQFQCSNKYGNLDGNGSSRWKQRAFYDYLKDVHAIIRGIPVIRISIYDIYDNLEIGYLLSKSDEKRVTDLCVNLLKQHNLL